MFPYIYVSTHLNVTQLHRLILNPYTVKYTYIYIEWKLDSFIEWNFSPKKLDPHPKNGKWAVFHYVTNQLF